MSEELYARKGCMHPKFRIYAAKEFERKLADERHEHPRRRIEEH